MNRFTRRTAIAVAALLLATLGISQTQDDTLRVVAPFERVSTDATSPGEHSVAHDCPRAIAMHPYAQPYDWPAAQATLRLDQTSSTADVTIHLTRVRPNTRFSAWLFSPGSAASSAGAAEAPLAPRSGAAALISRDQPSTGGESTRKVAGDAAGSNVFWSDANGNATFRTRLAFVLAGGLEGVEGAPRFTIRIGSHCSEHPGASAAPGPRQPWFEWRAEP